MESSPHLSSDMVFEVLSRTTLQSLDCSRSVCKEWKSLTYDPRFFEFHSRNSNIVSGYLVQSMVHGRCKSTFVSTNDDPSKNLSLDFLPSDSSILASSEQGLFVYESRRNHRYGRYYVCKPSTKQVVALPNPKMRYVTENVALVLLSSNPLHYKIIRFSQPSSWSFDGAKSRCEIFDSRIWMWKECADLVLTYGDFLMSWLPSICVSGSIYMLTYKDQVVAYDVNSESYKIYSLPIPTVDTDNYTRKRLVKYKGRLGFTCGAPDGCLELWIMKKCIKNEAFWKRKLVLKTQVFGEEAYYTTLAAFCNSGVAVMEGYCKLIFYNFKNHNINIVKLENQSSKVFAFRADFEPLNFNSRC